MAPVPVGTWRRLGIEHQYVGAVFEWGGAIEIGGFGHRDRFDDADAELRPHGGHPLRRLRPMKLDEVGFHHCNRCSQRLVRRVRGHESYEFQSAAQTGSQNGRLVGLKVSR